MTSVLIVYLFVAVVVFFVALHRWVPGDGPWPAVWAIFWPLGVGAALIGWIWDAIDMMLRGDE